MSSTHDAVNNPQHYMSESGLEAIEVIDAFFADNYYLGNAFKYLARAGKKNDAVEDLRKAQWYIKRYEDILVTENVSAAFQDAIDSSDGWGYDDAMACLYDNGYVFSGIPIVVSTVFDGIRYVLRSDGHWVVACPRPGFDIEEYRFDTMLSMLEMGVFVPLDDEEDND